ncbi:MAG: hypothetical protein RLZZ502_181, partial [Pseudomonadota bacterium]
MKVAIVYPGDAVARQTATAANNRFANLFTAFAQAGISAQPCVYHDDFAAEVRQQLLSVEVALVWVNPIENGRDRSVLDAVLAEVARHGVYVSAHPEIIQKLGTKQVLFDTRHLGCGSEVRVYRNRDELKTALQLLSGTRVLKQHRGHSGIGIWKVVKDGAHLRVRHAERGGREEQISIDDFVGRCAPYFAGEGRIIDQAFQARIDEGMVRCYLVQDKVCGFGHQAVVALHSQKDSEPRVYYAQDKPEFQALKQRCEQEWVPQ